MLVGFGIIFEIREKTFLVSNGAYVDQGIYLYLYVCVSWATLFHQRSILVLHH